CLFDWRVILIAQTGMQSESTADPPGVLPIEREIGVAVFDSVGGAESRFARNPGKEFREAHRKGLPCAVDRVLIGELELAASSLGFIVRHVNGANLTAGLELMAPSAPREGIGIGAHNAKVDDGRSVANVLDSGKPTELKLARRTRGRRSNA